MTPSGIEPANMYRCQRELTVEVLNFYKLIFRLRMP